MKELSQSRQIFRKRKGKLQISMAGSCYEKHYYAINDFPKADMEYKGLYSTTIGTYIHNVIQAAISSRQENVSIQNFRVDIPELNLLGELDLLLIDSRNKQINLYDFKVIGNFPWSLKFGKKKNQDKPSEQYQLQIATYTYGLSQLFQEYTINPYLIFIKRETGAIKAISIDNNYINKAIQYWKEVNEYLEQRVAKPIIGKYPTPIYDWECKYCAFYQYCQGDKE